MSGGWRHASDCIKIVRRTAAVGADLNEIPKLTDRVADYLDHIHELGMRLAFEQCCTQGEKYDEVIYKDSYTR